MAPGPSDGTGDSSGVSDLPARLHAALSKLGVVLKTSNWKDQAPRGLSPLQAQSLVLLRLRADVGARLPEIAAHLGITDDAAIELMLDLVSRRLARKPDGARAITFVLTDEGRAHAECVFGLSDALLESIATVTPEEQEHCFRTVIRILRSMQDRGKIPVAGLCVTCRYFQSNVHESGARPHHCTLVDAPLADAQLRVDCPEHAPATSGEASRAWEAASPPRALRSLR